MNVPLELIKCNFHFKKKKFFCFISVFFLLQVELFEEGEGEEGEGGEGADEGEAEEEDQSTLSKEPTLKTLGPPRLG